MSAQAGGRGLLPSLEMAHAGYARLKATSLKADISCSQISGAWEPRSLLRWPAYLKHRMPIHVPHLRSCFNVREPICTLHKTAVQDTNLFTHRLLRFACQGFALKRRNGIRARLEPICTLERVRERKILQPKPTLNTETSTKEIVEPAAA